MSRSSTLPLDDDDDEELPCPFPVDADPHTTGFGIGIFPMNSHSEVIIIRRGSVSPLKCTTSVSSGVRISSDLDTLLQNLIENFARSCIEADHPKEVLAYFFIKISTLQQRDLIALSFKHL